MAGEHRKLKYEMEVGTAKAERQVAKAAAAGMSDAADASERMARNVERASDGLKMSARQMASVAAGMGGMLLGTAAKAASVYAPENSAAQTALSYGGAALQGAGAGAAIGANFGPAGAAIGALAGAIKSLTDQLLDDAEKAKRDADEVKKLNDANRALYDDMLESQRRTEEFRRTIVSLGDAERPLADRQQDLAAEIEKRRKVELELKTDMLNNSRIDADEEDRKRFEEQKKRFVANRAELERLENMQQQFEKTKPHETFERDATNALARVGATFGGGGGAVESLRRAEEQRKEANAALKTIAKNTNHTTGGRF